MRKSFFDLSLSLEEDTSAIVDDAVANGGDEPIEATDIVDTEEATQELVEAQNEAEQQVEKIEEAEEIKEDLEDQLEEQEKIIENNPDQVTEQTVQVAQESLLASLTRLGMSFEDASAYRISFEADGSSPLQKFIVSTEGIKDVLKTIKDSIIKAIQAVINTIKKLWQNASIFFDRSEKTANKLIAEYKDAKGSVDVDDALVKKINAKFGGWFIATGKYDFNAILDFAKEVKVPKGLQAKGSLIDTIKGIVTGGIKSAQKLISGNGINTLIPQEDASKDANVVYLMGSKITYITNEDIKSAEVKIDSIDEGKSKSALNSLNVAGILTYLKKAATAAKDMKKFQQDTFASLDSIIKSVKEEADKAKDEEAKEAKQKLALLRKIGTKFALETVNQYIGTVNGTVNISAALLKTTKKEKSK